MYFHYPFLGWFARVDKTQLQRLRGLTKRNFSHNIRDWKFEIKVFAELVSAEFSLWLAAGHLLPMSSQNIPSVCACVPISYSYKDTSQIGSESTHRTSQIHSWFFQTPYLQTQSHSEVLEARTLTLNFGGTQFSP